MLMQMCIHHPPHKFEHAVGMCLDLGTLVGFTASAVPTQAPVLVPPRERDKSGYLPRVICLNSTYILPVAT